MQISFAWRLSNASARLLHYEHARHRKDSTDDLVLRTLAWSADEVNLMPRPEEFGDLHQHLEEQKADVIVAAFEFNESLGVGEVELVAPGLYREQCQDACPSLAFGFSVSSPATTGREAGRPRG